VIFTQVLPGPVVENLSTVAPFGLIGIATSVLLLLKKLRN
jgi:hypothetical protein